tara:strand:+ start:6701 stop:7909 length:1209 start_codon:yes stop_codon:yes gene_type:complete
MSKRRKTISVNVGNITIGSDYPIRIQSMTNTNTADIKNTVSQIKELADAGSDLVRITVNDEASAKAVPSIISQLLKSNYNVPIIGDFHFNGHILLKKFPDMAYVLDKYRINPGNIGGKDKFDKNFEQIIKIAIKNNKPIRIGGNWGSINKNVLNSLISDKQNNNKDISYSYLIKKALISSVIDSADLAVNLGMPSNKIIISCKTSDVSELIDVYTDISTKCEYPLHLGLTEAGMGKDAIISSTSALAILLHKGIGDTIRVSLTPTQNTKREEEVIVCQQILSSLGMKNFKPQVVSCPGCGRTSNDYFINLSKSIKSHINQNMHQWKIKYPGVENMKIAVMGCIVNGPGESKQADIGISLPGNNEDPSIPIYIKGKKYKTLSGDNIETQFINILHAYIEDNYS